MENSILGKINRSQEKKRPEFAVGDKLSVHVRLKEGDKERIQVFRGVVISRQPKSGKGPSATFTIRKISEGVGVERIFPVHSPFIEKIEIDSSSKVRRSRLYYLRELKGKKARLKEAERFGEEMAVAAPAPAEAAVEAAPAEAAAPAADKAPKAEKSDKPKK